MDIKEVIKVTKKLNVLYVEDDCDLRKSATLFFENYFSSVTTAADGEEGLNKYFASIDADIQYDIIISDIDMPILNGIDMCRKILEYNPSVDIMFTSAHSEDEYIQSVKEMGVNNFLTKPIKMNILNEMLYKICTK